MEYYEAKANVKTKDKNEEGDMKSTRLSPTPAIVLSPAEGVYEISIFGGKKEEDDADDPDFVDVEEIEKWEPGKRLPVKSQSQETENRDVTHAGSVEKSEKLRSSLKPKLSSSQGDSKKSIKFASSTYEQESPYLTMHAAPEKETNQATADDSFMASRWSTSSSDTSANSMPSKVPMLCQLNDVNKLATSSPKFGTQDVIMRQSKDTKVTRKAYSLHHNARKRPDHPDKRRHSLDDCELKHVASLRDSAIDLVSDEENSEVYTAVSLAGTLSRNYGQNYQSQTKHKKKYIIIGAAVGFGIAVFIGLIVLIVLLTAKP